MRQLPRIASLVPAGTDIVAALGLSEGLVGVSHECDHPSGRDKPVLTESIVLDSQQTESSRAAAEIDARVREAAARGDPLYRVDRQAMQELSPDIVISQSICDVCAAGVDQVSLPSGAVLIDLTATSVTGLYADLVRVGRACRREDIALEVVESVRTRLGAVQDAVGDRDPVAALGLEWTRPPYTGGHWVPELFSIAGGEHVIGRPGEPSRRITWTDIADADPAAIAVLPCGYGLDAAFEEAQRLAPDFGALRAVRQHALWASDANTLFSRCTPQAISRGAEVLAGILHPDALPPPGRHEARRVPS